jgi:hypothetical protein
VQLQDIERLFPQAILKLPSPEIRPSAVKVYRIKEKMRNLPGVFVHLWYA